MRQADLFLHGEGDAWLNRNRDKLGFSGDPVADMIDHVGTKPTRVLEVGCSNGWRLAALRARYKCEVFGVEPSMLACIEAAERKVPVWQMTASRLPQFGAKFDLIIYGFCLYLTDPSDWFNIAAEGDHVLAPGGDLIIYDFADVETPYGNRYEHDERIVSWHVDFAKFWLAHPAYELIATATYATDHRVTLLRKHRQFEIGAG
jgi:SAM-dependent methyltransferase